MFTPAADSDPEQWNRASPEQSFRRGSESHVAEVRPPLGSHDHQVGLLLSDGFHDRPKGDAVLDQTIAFSVGTTGIFKRLTQGLQPFALHVHPVLGQGDGNVLIATGDLFQGFLQAVHVPLVDYIDDQQTGVEALGEADGRIQNVAGIGAMGRTQP